MFTRFVVGVAILFVASVAFGGDLRENEIIIGGGSCEGDGIWISCPSLYLRRQTPGLAVGMVQPPGKDRGYAYILVIKGDEQRKSLARYESKGEVSGSVATSRGFLEIANKRVAFEYQVEVDRTGKQTRREVLSINGKTIDIGTGRVVLVDLSSDKVSWKQMRIELPKPPTWPTGTGQVESQAKELLGHLRDGGQEFRDFLK